jgi:glycosyltransferase involved in cell wall biosynthesis
MRAIYLVPGSGDTFYCQNCVRDLALLKAMRACGADALSVPLYLPLEDNMAGADRSTPVFYGAIQVYLSHAFRGLSWILRPGERLMNMPWLLKWLSHRAGTTSARDLESLTLSMLQGEEGRQVRELDALATWLEREGKPEVVHLSNALLLGLARRLKQRLGVPIVCSLQDEDQWIDAMSPDGARSVWGLMAERAVDVDVFLSVSEYYATVMSHRLRLGADRIRVVPLGIDLSGFEKSPLPFDPPVIGYLSRLCESMGFGRLVEAFIQLKSLSPFHDLRLRATGGSTPADEPFLQSIWSRLKQLHYDSDVEIVPDFARPQRQAFLKSLTLLSVPVPKGEAFGAHQLEALAAGVPLVQPNVGAYPEIVRQTDGGLLYDPQDPQGLTTALRQLLSNPPQVRALATRGRQVVLERFGVDKMASRTLDIYREMRSRKAAG